MKMRKSLVLAAMAGGICMATSAMAQQVIYDNTANTDNFFWGGFLAAGMTDSQEAGDEVTFGGQSRELIELRFQFWNNGAAGSADTRVRFYELDGPIVGGVETPGTVILEETLTGLPHTAGVNEVVLPINNVNVPGTVGWTFKMTNRTGSTEAIGPLLYGPAIVGETPDYFFRDDGSGWAVSWFGGWPANPYAGFWAKITASGNVILGACCLPDGTCDDTLTQAECANAFGTYQGDNTMCGTVTCDDPHPCCLRTGDCVMTNEQFCDAIGGTFNAFAIDCQAAQCPEPGACCIANEHCVVASQTQCGTAQGSYSGDGTNCGITCSQSPVLLSNGPLSTGEFMTSGSFMQAPSGTTWSESQSIPGCTQTTWGYSAGGTADIRIGDNFVVPGNDGWNVDKIDVFAYQTVANATHPPGPTPFVGATLRIWDGIPGQTGSNIVWGDTTTNVLASSTFSDIYRVLNGQSGNELDRAVFRNELTVGTHLAPGEYWIDYRLETATGGAFTPPVTIEALVNTDGANAVQYIGAENAWFRIAACSPPRWQDIPFVIYGEEGPGTGCYADCDGDGNLNINDFICFIDKFSVNDPYADCDGDGLFNINDFICFIDEFSQGCP